MRQVAGYKALQVDDHFFAKPKVSQASLRSKLSGPPDARSRYSHDLSPMSCLAAED